MLRQLLKCLGISSIKKRHDFAALFQRSVGLKSLNQGEEGSYLSVLLHHRTVTALLLQEQQFLHRKLSLPTQQATNLQVIVVKRVLCIHFFFF